MNPWLAHRSANKTCNGGTKSISEPASSHSAHAIIPKGLANTKVKNISNVLGVSGGVMIIALAAIGFVTKMQVSDIFKWVTQYFGLSFTIVFSALCVTSAYAIWQLKQGKTLVFWQEVGLQAANGISTLALTFTLLGISLGIGSLSQQSLTPENINNVISILTTQFSMAFMTTIVGLPTATAIRAWISIIAVKHLSTATN